MFRKFIALILATAMFVIPCAAFADTEPAEKHNGGGVIPPSIDRSHLKDKHYRIAPAKSKVAPKAPGKKSTVKTLTTTRTLPSYFIVEGLPGVRNQGSIGNCWAFSGMAAIESGLLTNYDISEIDLSEWHPTYFAFNKESDELYSFSKMSLYENSPYYDHGGNADMLIALLARGTGALYDDKAPTVSSGSDAYPVPSMPRDITLVNAYYVGNIGGLGPSGADWDKIAIVKEALVNYGAIAINIFQDGQYLNYSTNGYYTGRTTGLSTNHAVTLVGWDDNFSKTNFGDAVDLPTVDGAWIVMNNYGTSWGDKGFYYVSYAEASAMEGYIFEAEFANPQETIYQHDPLGPSGFLALRDSYRTTFANIFTAEESGFITKVATFTNETDLLCDIKVYTGVEAGQPESGTLVANMERIELPTPYYHTIELVNEIGLSEGERFSVVASFYRTGGEELGNSIPNMSKSDDFNIYQNVVINEGNSFILYPIDYENPNAGYTWHDMATYEDWDPIAVCLKAIVRNDAPALTITPDSASIAVGDTVQLSASLSGVTWSTDSTAASVSANGLVTGLGNGKAYVKAETDTRHNYAFVSVGSGEGDSGGNDGSDSGLIPGDGGTSSGSSGGGGGSGCNTGGYGILSLLFTLPFAAGMIKKKDKQ